MDYDELNTLLFCNILEISLDLLTKFFHRKFLDCIISVVQGKIPLETDLITLIVHMLLEVDHITVKLPKTILLQCQIMTNALGISSFQGIIVLLLKLFK